MRRNFSCVLCLAQKLRLESRIRNGQHRCDHFAIRLTAQIGYAIFRHHDIAVMPRNRFMAVAPTDIRSPAAARLAHRFERDDGTRAVQRESLGHEVELSAHAAHDPPVFEPIGNKRAHQRRHHRAVDETRLDSRRALLFLLAV